MHFIATSDLHGYLPEVRDPFDLLMICGDVCPAHDHYYSFQIEWIRNDFVEWINGLPFKTTWSKVVMIWGNHDFVGERMSEIEKKEIERLTGGRLVILNHEAYDFEYLVSDGIDSLKIFGTPYCSEFGNWAFMRANETLEKKYSEIGEDVDILLTHDSPNIYKLGAITEGKWKNDTTGNEILPKHIERIKPIIYHCGHFHSGAHTFEEHDGIMMSNVSFVNERYEPTHPFLEYDFDEETKKVVLESINNENI
jgi:Icc-related predicted phosphoesterase